MDSQTEVSPLRIAFLFGSLLCLSLSWTFGCTQENTADEVKEAMSRRSNADATARLGGTAAAAGAHGFVRFIQDGDSVRIIAELAGLPPGEHGFHVHEKGDCSAADFSSAGDHFAVAPHTEHGLPGDPRRHTGDLGNIVVSGQGTASLDKTDDVIALDGPRSIIGKALIVHERGDDGRDVKSAGARLMCGVIERADLRAPSKTSHTIERTLPVEPSAQPDSHTIPPLTPPPPATP